MTKMTVIVEIGDGQKARTEKSLQRTTHMLHHQRPSVEIEV